MFNLCSIKKKTADSQKQPEQPLRVCPSLSQSRTDHFQPQLTLTLLSQNVDLDVPQMTRLKLRDLFLKWCQEHKATRIFNKTLKQKKFRKYMEWKLWVKMLSDVFYTIFYSHLSTKSFHERQYYLVWWQKLSTKCVILLFAAQPRQWVHPICCHRSQIKHQKLGSKQSSLFTPHWQALLVSCLYENGFKELNFSMCPNSQTSWKNLQSKLWS